MNKVPINIHVQVLVDKFSTPLSKYQGAQLFSFPKTHQTVFQYDFAFPPAMYDCSCCSTFSSAFGVIHVTDFGCCNKCVMVSHCLFTLHFLDDICCGASFGMIICHL